RQSTRAPVTFQSIDTHDEQIEEEQDENGGHDGDDNRLISHNSVLEILSMLKEFQKRKAAKTSMRSAAFQNKKTALITEARETADTVVRDGVAYFDSFKARIAELRTQETSHQEHLKDLSMLRKNHDECMRNLLSAYSPFEGLSRRTTDHVNSASAMRE
ncbi:hypothetical protein WOLCODRAFT_84000, partial [Wolfiporia cocos MD-104 SS10]